ncbi:hypothetical protein DICVIV_14240 [Dictyocaulus viviparus]|uniref:Uncharacterized protein n=1 Tax=Dictyocaulus viviparus TaxID=29172 RepID=A0A0D8X5U8_DICVI|nr:hypothetical protein DICVIV_14240 [Dictyocaulus viviparus]
MCCYCTMIAYVHYDEASDVTRSVVYILLMIIWIMTVVETLYIFHKDRKKEIKEENDNKQRFLMYKIYQDRDPINNHQDRISSL